MDGCLDALGALFFLSFCFAIFWVAGVVVVVGVALWHRERERERNRERRKKASDASAGEGAVLGEDDDAALAGDVAFD